ncbi:MAG: class I SAM-dependent methyltransferase [Gillisia sp.]
MNDFSLDPKKTPFLTCKDFTVSGEEFHLFYDEQREMLVTHPQPSAANLPGYYQSSKYISHTDSKESFTDKIYQYIKGKMIQKKLKWISKKYPQKGRLLDIGAGTGEFLKIAKKKGWKVQGVEPDSKARELSGNKGIILESGLSKFRSEKFDVITLWHVMEHLPDLKNRIIEIQHLLKKNGLLVIAVPNFRSYDAQYYGKFWAAYDVPRHLWHFSKNSLSELFSPHGFRQTDSKPLIFDSFYVSMLSEKYRTRKTNFINSFFIGLKSNLQARKSGEYSSLCYFFRKES